MASMDFQLPEPARRLYIQLRSQKWEAVRAEYETAKASLRQELASKNVLRSGWGKAAEWELKRKFLFDMVRAEFEAVLEVYELHRVPFTALRCQRILEEAKQSLIGKFRSALTQSANGMSDVKIPISKTSELAGQLQSGNFTVLRDLAIELERRRLAWQKEATLTTGYNRDLAIRVLEHLRAIFPRQSNSGELMAQLNSGAPYHELLTVLDALLKQGLMTGKPLRGNGELHDVAALEISATGREWLRHRDNPESGSAPSAGHVVHGDHIVNYGNVGAIGRGATGSVAIVDQSWHQLQSEIDLQALTTQLAALRVELRKTASSREDDAQLGVLAEAETEAAKGNGARVLEILKGVGKNVLETGRQIGVELVVKLILAAHGVPIS
jgi:hypothetical protein